MFKYSGYESDFEVRDQHVEDAIRAFMSLFQDLSNRDLGLDSLSGGEATKRARHIVERADNFNYVLEFFGEKNRTPLRNKMADFLTGKASVRDSEQMETLENIASNFYSEEALGYAQEGMKQDLQEVMRFLPPKLTIEIDPTGKVSKITDLFANRKEDIEYKIKKMRNLISQYNDIVETVDRDMTSSDLKTRLLATITAIIMETGIRPGGGSSWAKDESGDYIKSYSEDIEGWGELSIKKDRVVFNTGGEKFKIKTFGATSLKGGHLDLFGSFATLKFKGKSSTTNFATITNKKAIQVLSQIASCAKLKAGGLTFSQDFLFQTSDGPITSDHLSTYFEKRFRDVKPNEFRKLRATTAVLESLQEQKEILRAKILRAVEQQSEEVEKVARDAVIETLENAVEEAAMSLNHFSGSDITISNYINPLVILNYIQNGEVSKDIKDAVMYDPTTITFDPRVFIQKALGRKSASYSYRSRKSSFRRFASLGDLLEDLESERVGSLGDVLEDISDLF